VTTRAKVKVTILCEDLLAATVVRRLLIARGFAKRNIYVHDLPSGAGAGSQFVHDAYPTAVRAVRRGHVAASLVVHTDADNRSVQERHADLATALAAAAEPARAPNEPIALIVPKWEIDTWVHHARGNAVVESTAYTSAKIHSEEAAAADDVIGVLLPLWEGTAVAPAHLPSIATAVGELGRLP